MSITTRAHKPIEYISRFDPAIDKGSNGYDRAEYERAFDRKYLGVPREGFEPTVFTLKRLTRRQFLYVSSLDDALQNDAAIAYGLAGAKGLKGPDGADISLGTPKATDMGPMLEAEARDALFAPSLVKELADVIVNLTDLGPTSG